MSSLNTLADLVARLGGVPLERIRFHPPPGSATVQDVIDIHEHEGGLCELGEGVLVEKTMGFSDSVFTSFVGSLLVAFVIPRNLGIVTGPDGAMQLRPGLVRMPDVAFINWDRMPGRRCPTEEVPRIAPNLAVEVLNSGNTSGEMAVTRREFFAAGVELVWEIDPRCRTIAVYTSESDVVTLGVDDTLDGGTVLPGFTLSVQTLFAELDRQG